jgi:hypothetical protein
MHAAADAAAQSRLRRLAAAPPRALGVTLSDVPTFEHAVALLQSIDACVSPLAKLELFADVQTAIAGALGERSTALSTDDALPLALLATARAGIPFLVSTRAYVTLFGAPETMPPHLSYQLTTLHAVHDYVMSAAALAALPNESLALSTALDALDADNDAERALQPDAARNGGIRGSRGTSLTSSSTTSTTMQRRLASQPVGIGSYDPLRAPPSPIVERLVRTRFVAAPDVIDLVMHVAYVCQSVIFING